MSNHAVPSLRQARHSLLAHGDQQAQYGGDRLCVIENCRTMLSRYNPSPTCAVHAGWKDSGIRQRG